MKLSIIIPTLNRYSDLKNTIIDLDNQNFQNFEVIIIDQTDQKDSIDVSSWSEKINYFKSNLKSASAGRNIGINKAKGEILLFLDDDVIIENVAFLDNHLRNYKNPEVPGVVGCTLEQSINQQVRYHRHPWSRKKDIGWLFFPTNYGCYCKVENGRSNNLSVRRSVAIKAKGMDENYEKGAHREEADFCFRVVQTASAFNYDPHARLVHIGNAKGGIRSWNKKESIKAEHHFVGGIYFILKNVPLKHYPHHWYIAIRYFVFNKKNLRNPSLFAQAIKRFYISYRRARALIKQGPVYLKLE